MKVFNHHIYEYCKGLRNLVLHTLYNEDLEQAVRRLENAEIAYMLQPVGESRTNIFFGAKECVEVIRSIGDKSLSDYTAAEDFILGTMLGYDGKQQCERYLERKPKDPLLKLCQCAIKGKTACAH